MFLLLSDVNVIFFYDIHIALMRIGIGLAPLKNKIKFGVIFAYM